MKIYQLTNTTPQFIELLNQRGIEYNLHEDGSKFIYIWVPNAQYLFELGQEYENIRNVALKDNAHVNPVFSGILNSIKPSK